MLKFKKPHTYIINKWGDGYCECVATVFRTNNYEEFKKKCIELREKLMLTDDTSRISERDDITIMSYPDMEKYANFVRWRDIEYISSPKKVCNGINF